LPEVDESGRVVGYRTDATGAPITTSLSAEGEAELAAVAETTGGAVVRSQAGETGIQAITTRLGRLMSEELSERVETVYADVYMYPLAAALLLLLIDTFIGETRPRRTRVELAAPRRPRRRVAVRKRSVAASALFLCLFGCEQAPDPFVRYAPPVDRAIAALDAGDAGAAVDLLSEYLSTGKCEGGNVGTPEQVSELANAGFDLGLGLFHIAEQYGRRFGEPEPVGDAGPTPEESANRQNRSEQADCALRIVRLIADDREQPIELRARAHYLAGNLEFLRGDYRAAVEAYEQALYLIPGMPADAGDPIGSDAAHNRAVALRRIQDEPDASPPDASPDATPDAGNDAEPEPPDGGEEPDAGDQESDAGDPDRPDSGAEPDASPESDGEPDAGAPDAGEQPQSPPPRSNQDERMLDMLEQAPTLQEHDAKRQAAQGRRAITEDK
jgi:tetratricopeptide (TPR) repeat protein